MRKTLAVLALLAGMFVGACSSSPLETATVGPSPLSVGSTASTAGISCSDQTPSWISQNQGPSGNHATVFWTGERADNYTYLVAVDYNRSGVEPLREVARFKTNRTEARIVNSENGGRYYVRVRITHNPCGDVAGDWSPVLVVYFDGNDTNSQGPVVEPPDDDDDDQDEDNDPSCNESDDNNGHGNDCDGDDEDNPGNSGNGGGNDEDDDPPAPPADVTLCHKPGTKAEQTLSVPAPAVPGHLGHGDYLGACVS